MPTKSATIAKAVLAAAIQEDVPDLHLARRGAVDLVELVLGTIVEALEDGEDVLISGFGSWRVREKAERPGRNPATGEQVTISARRVVTWRPSAALREAMNEEDG